MREMKDSGVVWIGEIPREWCALKTKYEIISNDGGIWGNDPTNTEADKIVIRSTEQTIDGKWEIIEPAKRDLSSIFYANNRIKINDLLMTKSSGSKSHIGKTTLADDFFIKNECYYSNFIQRIRVKCNPKYAWYFFNSVIAREQFVYLQNSTSGIGNINAENISNIYMPKPEFDVQQKIAELLDKKCTQIDTLISNQQQQIEKLKAYKQSLITEVVTKGLNPDVPMKDSGVEWIGEIPEKWEIVQLSSLVTERKHKNIGMTENNLLSLSYGNVIRKNINTTDGLLPENFEGYNIIENGDIVLRLTDLQNDHKSLRTGLCKERGIITSAYVTLANRGGTVMSPYLHYALHSFDIYKGFYGMGAGVRQGLNFEGVKKVLLTCPPLLEQAQIIEYIDKKCSEIDSLIAIKQQKIEKLQQYKKSVIYEYVTGKKEVE